MKEIFEKQKRIQRIITNKVLPYDNPELLSYHALGLIAELGEVLQADKRWKPWNKTDKVDFVEKNKEIADCWLFLINLTLNSNIDIDELKNIIKEKQIEVLGRQKSILPHLIIEGPNKTGKTELSKRIKEIYPEYNIIHDRIMVNKYKNSCFVHTLVMNDLNKYIKLMEDSEQKYIFDRFHWTELVYGGLQSERKYPYDCEEDIFGIQEKLKSLGNVKVILMEDDLEKINERNGKDMSKHVNGFFEIRKNNRHLDVLSVNLLKTPDDVIKDFIEGWV